jgi:hypothetical protein
MVQGRSAMTTRWCGVCSRSTGRSWPGKGDTTPSACWQERWTSFPWKSEAWQVTRTTRCSRSPASIGAAGTWYSPDWSPSASGHRPRSEEPSAILMRATEPTNQRGTGRITIKGALHASQTTPCESCPATWLAGGRRVTED